MADLVDVGELSPDPVVAAREKAGFPTVLLRGFLGQVGETITLRPSRNADSWTEILQADIVGAVQNEGAGDVTLIVRRDVVVRRVVSGNLSDHRSPVDDLPHRPWKGTPLPTECVSEITGPGICYEGEETMWCEKTTTCTTGMYRKTTIAMVPCGSCLTDDGFGGVPI